MWASQSSRSFLTTWETGKEQNSAAYRIKVVPTKNFSLIQQEKKKDFLHLQTTFITSFLNSGGMRVCKETVSWLFTDAALHNRMSPGFVGDLYQPEYEATPRTSLANYHVMFSDVTRIAITLDKVSCHVV